MTNLNLVSSTVKVDGKEVYANEIILKQKFNEHHTFTLKIDYQSLEEIWMSSIAALFSKLGTDVIVMLEHDLGGGSINFEGIITNIYFAGQLIKENYIVIEGKSKTILLDGEKTMYSFLNSPLLAVASGAVENSGNKQKVTVKPKFNPTFEYFCQYNENCFEFLNRLSWLYGEWFYCNGTDIFFGKPDVDESKEVTHDIEMSEIELGASITTLDFTGLYTLNHTKEEIAVDTPQVEGVAGNHDIPVGIVDEVYSHMGVVPASVLLTSESELTQLVKVQKARKVSSMHMLSGKTKTSKINIGDIIKFKMPANMKGEKSLGSFLIIDVEHHYKAPGKYTNTFKAIPSGMQVIPMRKPEIPRAFPQLALVKDNADPKQKGRVKVQFQWQKHIKGLETDWIRVQTPDAGKSDKVNSNRGMVFIPEVGDQVVVNFEDGDPNRPYVAGSMFQETVGGGGGDKNRTKSLTTRSGATITLDDNEGQGQITISDPSGNVITLHGNNKISIVAPDEIKIDSKKVLINGSELIQGKSKTMIELESENDLKATAKNGMDLIGKEKVAIKSDTLIEEEAQKITIYGKEEVEEKGSTIVINGGETNITGKPLNLN